MPCFDSCNPCNPCNQCNCYECTNQMQVYSQPAVVYQNPQPPQPPPQCQSKKLWNGTLPFQVPLANDPTKTTKASWLFSLNIIKRKEKGLLGL